MLGYLVPHPPILIDKIGLGDEKKCENTLNAYDRISSEIADFSPDTIVLISPHAPIFSDAFFLNDKPVIEGSFTKWGIKDVNFSFTNDLKLIEKISALSKENDILLGFVNERIQKRYGVSRELDHGALIPLYFITKRYSHFNLIHTSFAMVDDIKLYKYGMIINKALEILNKRAVIIASGDLSHKLSKDGPYGYAKEGVLFDRLLCDYIKEGDIKSIFEISSQLSEKASECGFRSLKVLIGAFDGFGIDSRLYSYEAPFGIGYCVAGFYKKGEKGSLLADIISGKKEKIKKLRESEDEYIRLARESLEYFTRHKKYMNFIPEYVSDEMLNKKAGVFVSIKKDGQLRGCIGTIYPTQENIAKEIIRNAVAAGFSDPRFDNIKEDELDDLVYDVDVLSTPERVESADSLDPKRYGVIVKKGYRQGVLLPDLEGVHTVEDQLRIACEKAGIDYDQEDFEIERFTVERHK